VVVEPVNMHQRTGGGILNIETRGEASVHALRTGSRNKEDRGCDLEYREQGCSLETQDNQDSCSPMMIPSIQVKKKVMYCHLPLSPARDSRSFYKQFL
jgi:hypothetical protein